MIYAYLQSIHFEGIQHICRLHVGSHPSDLLRVYMYTLCMCRLSFVLVNPVRFCLSFFFLFLFFFSFSVMSSPKLAVCRDSTKLR